MINLNDICSLSEFQRNAKEHVERLSRTGQPQVLTVNGKAAIVVQDAAAYQKLLDDFDRLDALEGIRRGLEDMRAGRVRPFDEVMAELEAKYETPPQ